VQVRNKKTVWMRRSPVPLLLLLFIRCCAVLCCAQAVCDPVLCCTVLYGAHGTVLPSLTRAANLLRYYRIARGRGARWGKAGTRRGQRQRARLESLCRSAPSPPNALAVPPVQELSDEVIHLRHTQEDRQTDGQTQKGEREKEWVRSRKGSIG
jgi:hypothetical protein